MNGVAKGLITGLAALALSACGGDSDDDVLPVGKIRALHASPDAPNVDVYVNGVRRLEDVAYQQASRNLQFAVGDYQVDLNVTGTDNTVLSETFTIGAGDLITLIAANEVDSLEYLAVEENGSSVTAGNARVNVVHGSPSAGDVDIYVSAYGDPLPDTPTLDDVPFKASSSLGEVPEGTYQVRITGSSSTDVVFDSGPLELNSGDNLTAVAVDSSSDPAWSPVDLVILTGTSTNPVVKDDTSFVRVIHGVPATDVDVYVNGSLTFEDFSFSQSTGGYVELNSTPQLDVTLPDDAIGNAVISAQPELERGAYYTVIANGTADGNDGIPLNFLLLTDDLSAAAAGKAKLRVVHAAPFAEGTSADVDVWAAPGDQTGESSLTTVSGEIQLATSLGYQEDTGYLSVDNAQYTALVTLAGDTDIQIDAAATLDETAVYTAVAVGDVTNAALEILLFADE